MATDALLAFKNEDGSYTGAVVYCDGAPGSMAEYLTGIYKNKKAAKELVDLGSIMSLRSTFEQTQANKGQYKPFKLNDNAAFSREAANYDFAYVYSDGKWHLYSVGALVQLGKVTSL